MVVDYNKISKTFSNSRKNMKWEEIQYFLSFLENQNIHNPKILDIGCGNGRLLGELVHSKIVRSSSNYLGIDYSEGLLEEAEKIYPNHHFIHGDMREMPKFVTEKYDVIFLIASFHHLESEKDRLGVLKNIRTILKEGGHVLMTNWWLDSKLNNTKYGKSKILSSQNNFSNFDYSIKIGNHNRYYHGFSIKELDYLFCETHFKTLENRGFSNNKNFISILQK